MRTNLRIEDLGGLLDEPILAVAQRPPRRRRPPSRQQLEGLDVAGRTSAD
jgi:hypothetical protein